MSKVPNNSYFVPRSLKQHKLWLSAKPLWKLVYDWLLEHTVYKEELPWDNNGRPMVLKRGQCCFTYRQIALDLKISDDIVEGAIKHFLGLNYRGEILAQVLHGDCTPLLRQQLRQQLRHEKSVVDILCEGYLENTPATTPAITTAATPATLRQHSGINKKEKKEEERKTTTSADLSDQEGPTKQMVVDFLFSKEIPEEFHARLFKKYKAIVVWHALQFIFAPGYGIETTPIQALQWACRDRPWEWTTNQPKKLTNREKVEQHFSDGVEYKGATCAINAHGISFHRGSKSRGAKFDEKTFMATLGNALDQFGIENPFQKTFNIKEA